MDRILVVFKSEFLRRVRSKWFIVATVLAPLILLGVMIVPPLIGYMSASSTVRTIAVIDETGMLTERLARLADSQLQFVEASEGTDAIRQAVQEGIYDGYLILPSELLTGMGEATYYSVSGGGLTLQSRLERMLEGAVHDQRLHARNAPPEVLEILQSDVPIRLVKLTEEGETADATAASFAVGMILGFIVYIAMFIYGAYVMHGVMEEKQSRVVEVVISSVRPFELLMGKILGIGAMGLVQMAAWAVILMLISVFAGSLISLFLDPAAFNLPAGADQEELLTAANVALPELSFSLFAWFLLFFLGGYLLYASYFAAIGSAVESQQDAQGLMLPVTLLIIVPMFFLTIMGEQPNSTLSVVLSMIPFFSPVLMIVRLAVTSVPFWQVATAFLLLVGMLLASVWISARIYRVGILMYGKKPSYKDLVRWMRYS